MTVRRRHARALRGLYGVCCAAVLVACTPVPNNDSDGDPSGSPSGSPSSSPSEPAYLEVPEGIELTPQGTVLALGEEATIAWSTAGDDPRPRDVAVVRVKVRAIEKRPIKDLADWRLDEFRDAHVFFVRITVTNVGRGNIGGTELPLFGIDKESQPVVPHRFIERFGACPSELFPKKFPKNTTLTSCQVLLVDQQGSVTGIVIRPHESFTPIVWEGDITKPAPPKKKKKKKSSEKDAS